MRITEVVPEPELVNKASARMDKLIEALGALVSSGIVALLTWWLTTRARNHQDQEREREALRGQADALIVAVSDLRMAADVSREMWSSRNATRLVFLEAGLIALGGAARARIAGGTDVQSGLVGLGQSVQLVAQWGLVGRQAAAALREPFIRIATAAAPLLRCSDPAVITATEALVAATRTTEGRARLEEKLAAFGRAARAATTPPPTWQERRRARRAG
ncbi:hypothetical protein AB0O51_19285 [Streptomyces sp. NPDC090301]|uniref:hypothetical protein n=1 Tax=Streptomyces sp. NPDC090301 TaxID=3154975 RepID=UPI003446379A